METEKYWYWTEDRIDGLKKLINWYEGLPEGSMFSIPALKDRPFTPIITILVWLRGLQTSKGYGAFSKQILNDLVAIRKEWIGDTIGV